MMIGRAQQGMYFTWETQLLLGSQRNNPLWHYQHVKSNMWQHPRVSGM